MGEYHVFGIAVPVKAYERSKPIRDRKYLAFVRSLPCLVCCSIKRVEAAHFGPHGLGQKASDLSAIPLCKLHHRKGPHSIHALGPVRFQEQHRLDIPSMIEKLNQFYSRIRRAEQHERTQVFQTPLEVLVLLPVFQPRLLSRRSMWT